MHNVGKPPLLANSRNLFFRVVGITQTRSFPSFFVQKNGQKYGRGNYSKNGPKIYTQGKSVYTYFILDEFSKKTYRASWTRIMYAVAAKH
jgi:hypothetical protein